MTSIVKLPSGPSVPYNVVLNATRQTFERLGHALTGRVCEVNIVANGGATAGVSWSINHTNYPYTTDIMLSFPSIPPHTMLKRSEADRMVALLVHELMHVYATQRPAWLDVVGERDPLLKNMVNALEDARIEALAIREARIPAARDLFASLNAHFLGDALAKGFSMHKLASLPYGLAVLCRVKTGQDIPLTKRIKGAQHLKPAIKLALSRINRCKNTAHVVTLARDVVRLARELEAQHQQELEQQRQQDQQDQQDQPGEAPEGQDGQDQPGEAPEGQDGQDQPGEAPEGQDGQDQPGEAPESQDGYDPEEATKEMFRRIAAREGEELGDDSNATDYRASILVGWRGMETGKTEWPPEPGIAAAARASIPNPVSAKDMIRRKLRAPDTIATEHRLIAGRLDRRALPRIPAGARDVFSKRIETDATNVGVVLVLDGSGSMSNGRRHPMAIALGIHFTEACQQAGAECMVACFVGAKLTVLKDWNERTGPRVAAQIGAYPAAGGTALTPSIMQAADMLARKPDFTRRIVMTLTDGGCNFGDGAVNWACRYARAQGVEVIGIILEPDEPDATLGFPDGTRVPVNDPADLSKLALGALGKALERRA